jgi:cytoskeletal protein RodZ
VLLVAGALIVVGGAAAWYFHFRPLRAMQTAPTPVPANAAVAQPTATALPATAPAPAIQPGGNTPGAESGGANAVAPMSAPVPTAWDLTSAPTAPPTSAPVVEPIASAPAPTRPPQHAPAKIAARPARPAANKALASSQDRVAPMVSPDWAGRAPIYVVHFSSYHDRNKATSDAARIAAEFRRPAYVAKVNLGAEGEWYRVVVGDFTTADEAFAYHAELLARHVPDVAQVYHLTAPK